MSAHAYRRVTDALDAHGSTGRDHGGQAMYQCPAHEDRTPSLSITDKPDRVLVNCRAGCDTLAALDALGLEWGDLFDNPAVGKWTTSALRSVGAKANGNGRVTLGAVNYKPGAANGETKSLAVKGSKRDLWPDPHSVEGSVVYVVEGEPDAVTAAQLELPAVGVPGAGKWRAEWANRIAAGRDRVVVIGDCDAPGRKATQKWAAAIAEHCADVRVLDLDPGRNDGYDLGDYVAEARDDAERADVRRAIVTAAENSPRVGQVGHPGGPASNGRVEPNSEGGPGGPTPRGVTGLAHPCKLRILDVAHMLATEPPPIPWVVQPLLVEACVTMLAGREGQGKSMLALALASAIGHGANVAGLDCQAGKVLYIDAENGEREAHRRVRGLGVKPGTLVYVEAVGFNLAANVDLIADLVDEHGPSVVVLDSLRSLAPGLDENDSRPAEAALRPVSRLAQDKGLPVLLLHHAGKQGVEYRGSTAIGAAVELGFTLSRREEDPDKRTRRRLACWKSRPAPEPETRWIALESRDGLIMLGEAEPFEGDDSRPRDQLREQVLAVLGGIPRSARSVAKAVGRRPDDSTVKRVLGDLHGEGLADKESAGWVRHRVTPLGDDALDAPPAPGLVEGSSSVTDALFVPNGDATCEDCGARLTGFGGRLVCVGCASGGAS